MKLSKNEWLIFGGYCFIGEDKTMIIKNLKFRFNEKLQYNINILKQVLDNIDNKGYSLNVKIKNEFNKLNLIIETSKETYIFKDIYIVNLTL